MIISIFIIFSLLLLIRSMTGQIMIYDVILLNYDRIRRSYKLCIDDYDSIVKSYRCSPINYQTL